MNHNLWNGEKQQGKKQGDNGIGPYIDHICNELQRKFLSLYASSSTSLSLQLSIDHHDFTNYHAEQVAAILLSLPSQRQQQQQQHPHHQPHVQTNDERNKEERNTVPRSTSSQTRLISSFSSTDTKKTTIGMNLKLKKCSKLESNGISILLNTILNHPLIDLVQFDIESIPIGTREGLQLLSNMILRYHLHQKMSSSPPKRQKLEWLGLEDIAITNASKPATISTSTNTIHNNNNNNRINHHNNQLTNQKQKQSSLIGASISTWNSFFHSILLLSKTPTKCRLTSQKQLSSYLLSLDLSNNSLTAIHMIELGIALQYNTILKSLLLSDNPIGDLGIQYLFLPHITTTKTATNTPTTANSLSLSSYSPHSLRCSRTVVSVLSIRLLALGDCNISNTGIEIIKSSLETNNSFLERLYLYSNPLIDYSSTTMIQLSYWLDVNSKGRRTLIRQQCYNNNNYYYYYYDNTILNTNNEKNIKGTIVTTTAMTAIATTTNTNDENTNTSATAVLPVSSVLSSVRVSALVPYILSQISSTIEDRTDCFSVNKKTNERTTTTSPQKDKDCSYQISILYGLLRELPQIWVTPTTAATTNTTKIARNASS